jgi:ribosomal-protein-alanine N-acetyltransferase
MKLPLITPMTPDDLDAVMELERRCFSDPWTRSMYLSDLTRNNLATYLVVRPPGAEKTGSQDPAAEWTGMPPILAYGGFWLMLDEAHICTLATHPEWRRCGLALWLMLALLERAMARGARISTLEVRLSNRRAQHLYEKLGYQVVGRRVHYYRDGEDGLIMTTPPLTEPAMRQRLAALRAEAVARVEACLAEKAGRVVQGLAKEDLHGRFAGTNRR